jgi:hypothetical protein
VQSAHAQPLDWESTLFRYGAPDPTGGDPGQYLLELEIGALGDPASALTEGRVLRFQRDARGNVVSEASTPSRENLARFSCFSMALRPRKESPRALDPSLMTPLSLFGENTEDTDSIRGNDGQWRAPAKYRKTQDTQKGRGELPAGDLPHSRASRIGLDEVKATPFPFRDAQSCGRRKGASKNKWQIRPRSQCDATG